MWRRTTLALCFHTAALSHTRDSHLHLYARGWGGMAHSRRADAPGPCPPVTSRAAARGRRARYSRRCSSDHRSVRRPPLSFGNGTFTDQVCLIVSHIRAIQLTQNKRNSPHAFTTPDFVAQICVRRRTNRFNCSRNTKGFISRLVGRPT